MYNLYSNMLISFADTSIKNDDMKLDYNDNLIFHINDNQKITK